VKVTHGSRVIDPSTGLTKLDLVRYYAQAASWALPHLNGRAAYIRRAPLGICIHRLPAQRLGALSRRRRSTLRR
jgi:DNA primase